MFYGPKTIWINVLLTAKCTYMTEILIQNEQINTV